MIGWWMELVVYVWLVDETAKEESLNRIDGFDSQ